MKNPLITIILTGLLVALPVVSAAPVGAQFTQTALCINQGSNSVRLDPSTGAFDLNLVGHSQVRAVAQVVSTNPIVLSFGVVGADRVVRISVINGVGTVVASFAHGPFESFAGEPVQCPETAPVPPNYIGNADGIICEAVWSWIMDMNRLNVPIKASIYLDGTFLEDKLAFDHRQDVQNWLASWGVIDNGNHGFSVPFPRRDGLPHTVSIRFEGSNIEVSGSPRTVTCQPFTAMELETMRRRGTWITPWGEERPLPSWWYELNPR